MLVYKHKMHFLGHFVLITTYDLGSYSKSTLSRQKKDSEDLKLKDWCKRMLVQANPHML